MAKQVAAVDQAVDVFVQKRMIRSFRHKGLKRFYEEGD